MTSAERLAHTVSTAFVELVHAGAPVPATTIEIIEPGANTSVEAGDLMLGVGAEDVAAALALVERAVGSAGIVLRPEFVRAPEIVARCADLDLTLLALGERCSWSALAQLLRSTIERAEHATGDGAGGWTDLFTLADTIGDLLAAPVTVEDHRSRVLAWSAGQADVDQARTSTIIGREVPRAVREHFRALGVFRHLATSDEPLLVPPGPDGIRARYVLPVRAGGEWLGSVWAVVDADVPAPRAAQVHLLTDVVAVHLLRMRAEHELHRQVETDQVRAVLRGEVTSTPDWLGAGPWHAVALVGPSGAHGAQLEAAARVSVWTALLRRHGWARPLLADLDGEVVALVPDGRGPGCLPWFRSLVETEHGRNQSWWATAGPCVSDVGQIPFSARVAAEQRSLGLERLGTPVTSCDEVWVARTIARAVRAQAGGPAPTPIQHLREIDRGGQLLATVRAVLRHWGDPTAAAREVGVHANTIRNRLARIDSLIALDLSDPEVRLAAWLECEQQGMSAPAALRGPGLSAGLSPGLSAGLSADPQPTPGQQPRAGPRSRPAAR